MASKTANPLLGLLSLSDVSIESPYPEMDVELSGVSLRETAYEILVACSGLNAVSARTKPPRTKSSITSTASRLKKAIVRPKTDKGKEHSSRGHRTIGETVRYQMEISEQSDDRIRRALIKAAAQQINKSIEAMLIPLELLLNITPSQFTDQSEYQQWRLRQLRVLTAGLVLHPASGHEGEDDALSDRLQQMLVELAGNSIETGARNEAWLSLRIAAMAKAGRAQNGENPRSAIHWADGFPMNVHLYECLLSSCVDAVDEAVPVDEFDEVLDWIKKTWGILGVNNMLHSLSFMWVLFNQFVKTGENEAELLVAAEEQMKEAAAELRVTPNGDYADSFRAAVFTIQAWAQKRVMQYREIYPQGAEGTMAALLSLDLTASRVMAEDSQRVSPKEKKSSVNSESNRVDKYIRSSMRVQFLKLVGASDAKRKAVKIGAKPVPALAILAEDVGTLAREERMKYSPTLEQWHPTPAGVAAAALHSCFRKELQKFTTGLAGISPDVVQVLQAADQLEKDLVQIAVEDGVDAEDGGKSLIREMPPYETQSVMDSMSKKWVEEAVGRLSQWADRNVQNEQWNPKATREGYAPSAVEVLRIIEEMLDAFFYLPISKELQYVKRVVAGVDQGVRQYCEATLAGCGKKEKYVPSLPALTRYNKKAFASKGGWRSMLQLHKSKISSSISSPSSTHSSFLPHLCVRINTLNHMSTELRYFEKRLRYGWLKDGPSKAGATGSDSPINVGVDTDNFREVQAELEQGVQLLIELASYRVIFHDLHRVFWEGLYAGGVENSRISQVIEQIDPQLGIVAEVVSEQLRNRIVAALMKACLDCLVLVLLAGGPSRAFVVYDADILEEDLIKLKDLFKADGEGLPDDLVDNAAAPLQKVLRLFHISSEKLIESLCICYPEAELGGSSRFSKAVPLPRTTGDWSPLDANTILRVLCYRGDGIASKYLKRIFNLPKRLSFTQ